MGSPNATNNRRKAAVAKIKQCINHQLVSRARGRRGGRGKQRAQGGVKGGSKRRHSVRETSGVVRMNSARVMSSCWSDQIVASGAKSETPWSRRDR